MRAAEAAGRADDVVTSFRLDRPETIGTQDQEREGRDLAVAVCTYRRAASLTRFLDSMTAQEVFSRQLVIVDASPDDETERAVRAHKGIADRVASLLYTRVRGELKGLTRQRNFALRRVETPWVAFFDDDIVLLPGCFRAMLQAVRGNVADIVGVGCLIVNDREKPKLLWRTRRALGVVSTLRPGRYCRSGMSIPWAFLGVDTGVFEGDWLQGGATMWRTASAVQTGFNQSYSGYSHGEDLEFSLRVRRFGRLVTAAEARVLHLQEAGGRPSAREMGYMTARNAYDIHRRLLPGRRRRDAAWFVYAFGVDALVRGLKLAWPRGFRTRWGFISGRFAFLRDLILSRGRLRDEASRPPAVHP